jgi:hemoglobin
MTGKNASSTLRSGVPNFRHTRQVGPEPFPLNHRHSRQYEFQMDLLDTRLYDLIGPDAFERLVAAFYERVPRDEILGPLYPKHDLAGAEQRLRDFLIMRFGGPDTYMQRRGHPRLRMRHARFAVTQVARDRWVSLMDQALHKTALPPDAVNVLRQFFRDAATFLINRAE